MFLLRACWTYIRIAWIRMRVMENPLFDKNIRTKQWVVIKATKQIAVVDHVKSDGCLGVRPVDSVRATYLPNPSKHWPWADRIRVPYEISVHPSKVRAANPDDLPEIFRIHHWSNP